MLYCVLETCIISHVTVYHLDYIAFLMLHHAILYCIIICYCSCDSEDTLPERKQLAYQQPTGFTNLLETKPFCRMADGRCQKIRSAEFPLKFGRMRPLCMGHFIET